jgi:ATP-dependent DNA helicase RecQ
MKAAKLASAPVDSAGQASVDVRFAALKQVIAQYWGFKSLRPLQDAAMRAMLERRDSLLVLPTGGGKSLCYQAPALVLEGTTVVISPLIALMKDQVDSLRAIGVPAAALNSSLGADESREIQHQLRTGELRLLFVSPERLATDGFRRLLGESNALRFAIDEAHCISHWGPDYRQLRLLKQHFPEASIHAFTATATPQVRRDIVEQLGISHDHVLVGNFDRPNLTYRVVPRVDVLSQAIEFAEQHRDEAGIIYCIRRRDVDDLTASLKSAKVNALPYHAGMTADQRRKTQNAFKTERCNLVVATVAFGMGIDRSNIRYVLHTGMPKSIEHYQQETGRAGRDGLEAECVLLYSAADVITWKRLMEKSVNDAEQPVDPQYVKSALKHLNDMEAYCRPLRCRHKTLVEYFGQAYAEPSCQACDVCLEDANVETVDDAQTVAKKILSCVARVKESFGVGHVVSVLRGENTEAIRSRSHNQLSTYGLLKEHTKNEVRDWVYQLLAQQALVQTTDDRPILQLNAASWEIMRDQREIKLTRHRKPDKPGKRSKADEVSWEGVDKQLFDRLRELRLTFADERGVPPYVIFSDATLRELARVRPTSIAKMHLIYGIGEKKLAEFGEAFMAAIVEYCAGNDVPRDCPSAVESSAASPQKPVRSRPPGAEKQQAMQLFAQGASIAQVAQKTGRATSTIGQYLCEYIQESQPGNLDPWVLPDVYRLVSQTIDRLQARALKPIFVELGEKIPYDQIRLVMTHKAMQAGE